MTVVECDTMPPHTPEGTRKKERNIQTNKNARKVGLWAENSLETHINGSSAPHSNEMEVKYNRTLLVNFKGPVCHLREKFNSHWIKG